MTMNKGSAIAPVASSGTTRGDSSETRALASELYAAMRRGQETSLALLSCLSVDQMHRELTGEARLHVDTALSHLATFDRSVAIGALEDLLDLHRRRVLPECNGRQLDLFGRLTGGRP